MTTETLTLLTMAFASIPCLLFAFTGTNFKSQLIGFVPVVLMIVLGIRLI